MIACSAADASAALVVRAATPADVDEIVRVEAAAWPPAMAASREQLLARLAVFPTGQLVALFQGKIVGLAGAQRITAEQLSSLGDSYARLTDGGRFTATHHSNGELYHLIGVSAEPAHRGLRVGRTLVDRQIEQARKLPGVRRILGFTRPVGYHQHQQLSIEEYAALRDDAGHYVDPVLAFHLESGARLVSLHPGFRPEDDQTCGYAALIEYPV